MIKYYVYRVCNVENGKFYIGAKGSKDPENDNYFGSGKALNAAIEAEGKCNFRKEIIAVFDTPEEASALEAAIVTREFVSRADTYNLRPKGGRYPGTAQRRKFSAAKVGERNPMFEHEFTQEHRERLSDAQRGKRRSAEHRARISASIKAHWEKRRDNHSKNPQASEHCKTPAIFCGGE